MLDEGIGTVIIRVFGVPSIYVPIFNLYTCNAPKITQILIKVSTVRFLGITLVENLTFTQPMGPW